MLSIQSLVIIGSGNVATHIGVALKEAGIEIIGIYSPTIKNAQKLATKLNTVVFKSITEIPIQVDAYLLAVTDSVLPEIVKEFPAFKGILMHTSGSVGMDVYPEHIKRAAVFYPLQTFSKAKPIDFSSIPILIESTDREVLNSLQELGKKISGVVKTVDSHQRKQVHLAAVFACNFSNFMFHIAQELMTENDLDFALLKPLIGETVEKLKTLTPLEAQTGPAFRLDIKIMNDHLEILKKHPKYQDIYHLISDQIQKIKPEK